jgi:AraC family transcriptional regulator of adaptative response/methylated-DNA-[protein]-cysteine methyltransferase
MTATAQLAAPAHLDQETAWQQLMARDASAGFLYGVTTTGVFCRPSCKSRRPLRDNVRFFAGIADASAAGFRPCLRCKPDQDVPDVAERLARVRAHLEANVDVAMPLSELARVAGLSPFTLQRAFKAHMGASPLQYQRALRAGRFRTALKRGSEVTAAIYDAGFGSSSRAYEASPLGMTPARFAAGGKGETVRWAAARTPFGMMIVGATDRGICWLALADDEPGAEQSLREEFPAASLQRDPHVAQLVELALQSVRDGSDLSEARNSSYALDLRGTVFQLRVWQALRAIPRGETRTYSQLAREMGDPNATRAVARACATNRVAVLVPCHRVVGADGSLTGYRWGVDRKRQLLESERG